MDPIKFLTEVYATQSNFQEKVLKVFNAAFDNLERIPDYEPDKSNIHLYLILKILLYILNNRSITNRIANLYSKNMYYELIDEKVEYLYDICLDLNLKIKYYNPPIRYGKNLTKNQKEPLETHFRIHYTNYLKLTVNLRDDYRRLINNSLSNGYVFIQTKSLIRLLQEHIRNKFFDKRNILQSEIDDFKKNLLDIKGFKQLYEEITNSWDLKKEEFESTFEMEYKEDSDISTNFPPCLKEILMKAQEGQNLTHIERLFLVFFLHALNYPMEKIVNLFSTMPDFDRNKTSYQVNFAKSKGYTPHSCSKLKSLNLCLATKYKDDICLNGYYSRNLDEQKKIAHPLFYLQLKQFRSSKNRNKAKNKSK